MPSGTPASLGQPPGLDAYLDRIAYTGALAPDLKTLRALHWHHPLAVPFENLSTLVGEPVPIDIASVESKLISNGRGGYCFEQNALFQSILERIGFDVTPLAARVVWSPGHVNPRTHMVLLIANEGRRWLADVGFGGATLTAPLELVVDAAQTTPHESFRLIHEGAEYTLEVNWAGTWRPMYTFDLQPQLPVDYEALNHYVATHPASHFRTTLLAARVLPDRRLALVNRQYSVLHDGEPESATEVDSVAGLRELLRGPFGIDIGALPSLDEALGRLFAEAG